MADSVFDRSQKMRSSAAAEMEEVICGRKAC